LIWKIEKKSWAGLIGIETETWIAGLIKDQGGSKRKKKKNK